MRYTDLLVEVKLQVVCHRFPDDSDELAGTGETVNITYFTEYHSAVDSRPMMMLSDSVLSEMSFETSI